MPHKIAFDESVDCYFVHWTGALDREGLWGFMRRRSMDAPSTSRRCGKPTPT